MTGFSLQDQHVTLTECEAALEYVLAAPKDHVIIDQLCVRPEWEARTHPDQVKLTSKSGIDGDPRWLANPWLRLPDGTPDPRIQVSILPKRVADLCWRDRENTPHPGDLFIVDMDFTEKNLPAGSLLSAGSAILEVSTKFNTGCRKWHDRYGPDSLKWINQPQNQKYRLRGVLCKIVQDGVVQVGDQLAKI